MDCNKVHVGMKVKVIADEGTLGMLISPEILSCRQIGKTGNFLMCSASAIKALCKSNEH